MSELLENSTKRKGLLKHMILQLHKGESPEEIRAQLTRLMGKIPYGEIVEVEQELISEGLPEEEVLRLCDVHTAALKGAIDHADARTAEDTGRRSAEALRCPYRGVKGGDRSRRRQDSRGRSSCSYF
jgi:hypothetical protein